MKAYKLKIELIGSNPLIWRRVMLPADVTFFRLFDTIQNAMGWKGDSLHAHHLYEFILPVEKIRVTNDEDASDFQKMVQARKKAISRGKVLDPFKVDADQSSLTVRKPTSIKIDAYLEKYGHLNYTYDLLGDQWNHRLTLEATVDDYPFGYPALLDGEGDCPPEDVGGYDGYELFKSIFNNPSHHSHRKTLAWAKEQNYRPYDPTWINTMLKFIQIHKTEWDRLGLGNGHYFLKGNELDKYK